MTVAADFFAWTPEDDTFSAVDEIREHADRAWVRLTQAHPFFFAADHPIPAVSAMCPAVILGSFEADPIPAASR